MSKEMQLMTDNEVYSYHGWREQCKHLVEEVYELTEAIHDFELSDNSINNINCWNDLCEEIADVQFMLSQIKEHYLIQEINIKSWETFKRKRETKRIKDGYYTKE